MSDPMSKLEQGMRLDGIIPPEPEVVVEPMRVVMARKAVEAKLRRAAEELERERLASAKPFVPLFTPRPPVPDDSGFIQKVLAWSFGTLFAVLFAVAAFVPMERAQNTEIELGKYKLAKTVMVCRDGYSVAMNLKSVWTWVTGGSALVCTDWETPEGRDARELAKSEAAAKRVRE